MASSKAFIDETGGIGPDDALFAMGGYIATDETWNRFSDDWRSELDMEPRFPAIHMSELARRSGKGCWPFSEEEKSRRLERLAKIVLNHDVQAFVVHIPINLWKKYVQDGLCEHKRADYSNPYGFATFLISGFLLEFGDAVKRDYGQIEFLFDAQEKIGERMKASVEFFLPKFLKFQLPHLLPRFGGMHWPQKDDSTLPLQAADVLLWHYQRRVRQKPDPYPSVFQLLVNAERVKVLLDIEKRILEHAKFLWFRIPCPCNRHIRPVHYVKI